MRAFAFLEPYMSTTPLQERRAKEALQAAQRATERDKARRQEPQKRCASCGAPVHHDPKEGEGLPCGH